jgi:uncharacterized membrane protein YphA (DoxX/SURF4 family)
MRNDIDNSGFIAPSSRPLGHERRAATLAELVAVVGLALSTIIAATVVSVGIARADVAGNVIDNESGLFGIALLLGLIFIGIGGFSLLPTRRSHRH